MAVQTIRVDQQTWRFEEGGVRFFLLTGTERALLIDSGMETHNAKELAEALTDLPLSLLNTHTDRDHTGSNAEFSEFYLHPAETVNWYNHGDPKGNVLPVWDGDILDLGDRPLEIIHIPGHTPGSIAILDVKHRRLFSGDTVQDGGIFMFGPMREMHAYRCSLQRLETMVDRFDEIYPSHASCPVPPSLIQELDIAAEKILTKAIDGVPGEMFGNPISLYDPGPARFLCNPEKKEG